MKIKFSLKVIPSIIAGLLVAPVIVFAVVQSLNGISDQNQTFGNDSNVGISSSGTVHSITWSGKLPVSRGGTGLGSLVSGEILFGNTPSVSQSSNLYWNNALTRLGVGTNSPSYQVDVQGGQVNASGGLCMNGDCRTIWPSFSGIGGSGTTNYVTKFTNTSSVSNSQIFDNGSAVGIGTASVSGGSKLKVAGTVESTTGGFKFPDGTTQTTAATTPSVQVGSNTWSSTGTQVIEHGLGRTPKVLRIYAVATSSTATGSQGVYNGTTQSAVAISPPNIPDTLQTGVTVYLKVGSSSIISAVASFDGTNITLEWTRVGDAVAGFVWEVQ